MTDKYAATVKLDRMQYELLRVRYRKRTNVGAQTLVNMALSEIIREQAEKMIETGGYNVLVDELKVSA